MMARFLFAWQLGLAVMRLHAQDTAPTEVKAKLEVEELEKRWLAAANDVEALKVILAEDFVFIAPTGPVGKEQWLARMKQHPTTDSNESRKFDDLRIRVYGEVAVVNGTVVRTNLTQNSTYKEAFTDIFIYRDGRWQVVNSQLTPMSLPAIK